MSDIDDDWEEEGGARWAPFLGQEPDPNPALETEAMSEIAAALDPLDDEARSRVLRWAGERYGVDGIPPFMPESTDDRLPSTAQIRAWLTAHGWTGRAPGFAGQLWMPPGGGMVIGVPHGDEDEMLTAGAVARIAAREGRSVDGVKREMVAIDA